MRSKYDPADERCNADDDDDHAGKYTKAQATSISR